MRVPPRAPVVLFSTWKTSAEVLAGDRKTGLREFLAACGVRGTSANTPSQDGVIAEGGAEGPRRVVFDLETISQHEKAAGAKSEGLTIGPCCDYHGSKPVLLCDLEIVLLVLMRLRTSEVRELQAIMSHLKMERFTRLPPRVPVENNNLNSGPTIASTSL